ncbi:MAG TPA: enolase C-terminal domain-like protein [Opitutaceae bacterium]
MHSTASTAKGYRKTITDGSDRREMHSHLDQGYTVAKMKIGGAPFAEDLRRIEAALSELGPGQRLAVGANGRFDLPTAIAYGETLSLNIAAGLGLGGNELYPDLFQPIGGFPDGVEVKEGHDTLPEVPGIGFEAKAARYRELKSVAG